MNPIKNLFRVNAALVLTLCSPSVGEDWARVDRSSSPRIATRAKMRMENFR